MAREECTLDRVFQAPSNPTGRGVIERLSARPASMSELAGYSEMEVPSFLQRLQVLEDARLIGSGKIGRVRTFQINPPLVLLAENWLDVQWTQWNTRLNQFDEFLTRLHENNSNE